MVRFIKKEVLPIKMKPVENPEELILKLNQETLYEVQLHKKRLEHKIIHTALETIRKEYDEIEITQLIREPLGKSTTYHISTNMGSDKVNIPQFYKFCEQNLIDEHKESVVNEKYMKNLISNKP